MASTKNYLNFIVDQLSELNISYKQMMGEYILYYKVRIFGGIYDDRFLVKLVKSATNMMTHAKLEKPYKGAKDMILVDNVENRDFLKELITKMYEELPERRKVK